MRPPSRRCAATRRPLPADIVWRTERRLNDPDCKDASHPDRCAATAGKRYQQSRLGWAAQTFNDTCYESNGQSAPLRAVCERQYSWGTREGRLRSARCAHGRRRACARAARRASTGDCIWTWRPRRAGGKVETQQACLQGQAHHRARAVFARRAQSGVVGHGQAAGRPRVHRADVVVEDIFIVALGDSFASGESNPGPAGAVQRRRARWSTTRRSLRDDVAPRPPPKRGAAASGLPRPTTSSIRRCCRAGCMEDEVAERFYKLDSPRVPGGVREGAARWLSRDCHRSQYGYPFRVGIELALENRHRSVTLASFTCSGAEVADGLFLDMDPREGSARRAAPRCARSSTSSADLICRGGAAAHSSASYTLPIYAPGSTAISRAEHQQALVPAAATQAADRRRADVDRRQRRRLRRARGLFADRERRRPRADRRPGRQRRSASARRCRASTSTCSTSA